MDDQFYSTFLNTHIIAIILMTFFIALNLYVTLYLKDNQSYYKVVRNTTPLLHAFNAANIYVGLTMAGFYHMFNFMVIFMSVASIAIIILEAKRYKVLKHNLNNMDVVRKIARRNYTIELIVVFVVYVISDIVI